MPNPKRKHTPSRRDSRRASNFKLTASNPSMCPQCKSPRLSHTVCGSCGFYNGELVVPRKETKKKTEEEK
jgi:large subunit ribosomal protein L32